MQKSQKNLSKTDSLIHKKDNLPGEGCCSGNALPFEIWDMTRMLSSLVIYCKSYPAQFKTSTIKDKQIGEETKLTLHR